jgi:hypothetical protein
MLRSTVMCVLRFVLYDDDWSLKIGKNVEQNSQNLSGLFPSSGIPKNTMFRKLDLFPSSGEGGKEDTYSIGLLRES